MPKKNTPPPSDLAGARALLANLASAEAERPRAVCAMCGGVVHAGRDLVVGEPSFEDRRLDEERKSNGLPALHGWQRRHEACVDSVAVVRAITGRKVPAEVAHAALRAANPLVPVEGPFRRLALYAELRTTHVEDLVGWKSARPWAHLTDDERRMFADMVDEEAREHRLRNEPHRCTDGACGFCGVALALAWGESPLKWSNGTAAPACRDCFAVLRRRRPTRDLRLLRGLGVEMLSGASGLGLAEHFGDDMRVYADLAGDDHTGTDERWTYAPLLAEIREEARMLLPTSLPEPLRSEYTAKLADAREAAAARAAERREAERREELADWVS
ncbi:hypothetical protein M3672_07980 [Microbacterium enclense]|uniref:hypothetical protein n=1 Tax=Microbacterium enclense TaxID=993073 RepID=UPI00203EFF2B|nr:hypothetical protein [Microbacterium enclense]MCM3614378.1 hypothetical protein [Microbacterium enclense]